MKIPFQIKAGLIAGIFNIIAWYCIALKLGTDAEMVPFIDMYTSFTSIVLLLIGISISVFLERKNNSGFIEFKKALKTGALYALIIALCLAIFNFFYYAYIAPEAVNSYLDFIKRDALSHSSKIKQEDLQIYLERLKGHFGSFRIFMSTLIIGVILSLLVSAILRKKRPAMPFSEN